MVSRESVFKLSASAPEIGARSGPGLGLGPGKSPAPSHRLCASPMDTGSFAPSRIEPTTILVVVVPSSSRDAAIRQSSPAETALDEGRVRARRRASRRVAKRTGRCCYLPRGRAARRASSETPALRRSGPESPQPIHALLHSDASVRPRPARPAAGGTSRRRRPATRLRQCVAAEQLRGDDGARLRLLLPGEASVRWRPTRRLVSTAVARRSPPDDQLN